MSKNVLFNYSKFLYNASPSFTIYRSLFGKRKKGKILKPIPVKSSPFVYLRADRKDHNEINRVMKVAYYPEEPTCSSLGIKSNRILNDGVNFALAEGYSMVAKCKFNGKIVGACINGSTHPWDPDLKDKKACSIKDPKLRQLFLFYAHLQRLGDLWDNYSIQKVFECEWLFVLPEFRGQGIAKQLLQHSRILGRDCGFKIIRVDATSKYTADMCEKLGMEKIAVVPYCSYVGQNMKPVFKPTPPHDEVVVYIDYCSYTPCKRTLAGLK